jgi:hypothetical protein
MTEKSTNISKNTARPKTGTLNIHEKPPRDSRKRREKLQKTENKNCSENLTAEKLKHRKSPMLFRRK